VWTYLVPVHHSLAILTLLAGSHVSPKTVSHLLHTITNAKDREALLLNQLPDTSIHVRGTFLIINETVQDAENDI